MKPTSLKSSHWLKYNAFFIFQHLFGVNKSKDLLIGYKSRLDREIEHEVARKISINERALLPVIQEKESIFATGEPLLFAGGAKEWDACKKWSLPFFAENFGDRQVYVKAKGVADPSTPHQLEQMLLRDYIAELKQGTEKYLFSSDLAQCEKILQDDLDFNWLKQFKNPGSFGGSLLLFMGGQGTSTSLHNELGTVVFAQISGKKKWILYKPEDRIFLDAQTERKHYFTSDFNPCSPDHASFPLAKYARKYELILNPGDVLLLPPFTWHYVENETDTIAVAYKFVNLRESLKSSVLLTILYLLATKPFHFHSFFLKRKNKG